MYNTPLAMTGVSAVGAMFWWPMAIFAVCMLVLALYRAGMSFHRN